MNWKVKCSLCDARFKTMAETQSHIDLHTKNNKAAKPILRGIDLVPDYSDAEHELQNKYRI